MKMEIKLMSCRQWKWRNAFLFAGSICAAKQLSSSSSPLLCCMVTSFPFVPQFQRASLRSSSTTSLYLRKEEYKKNSKKVTVKELVEEISKDTDALLYRANNGKFSKGNSNNKKKRTRKKVETPKQTYLYAAQRKALEKKADKQKERNLLGDDKDQSRDDSVNVEGSRGDGKLPRQLGEDSPITISRKFGMNPALQFCDQSFVLVDSTTTVVCKEKTDDNYDYKRENNLEGGWKMMETEEPKILGELQVGGTIDIEGKGGLTGMYAYVIEKPAGWSILEGNAKKNKKIFNKNSKGYDDNHHNNKVNDRHDFHTNEQTTAQEEFNIEDTNKQNDDRTNAIQNTSYKKKTINKKVKYYDDESESYGFLEYNEMDILSVMTSEELAQFEQDGGLEQLTSDLTADNALRAKAAAKFATGENIGAEYYDEDDDALEIDAMIEKSIEKKSKKTNPTATGTTIPTLLTNNHTNSDKEAVFTPNKRPSLVSWLKEKKAMEGSPIRGGKNWKAITGAVDIDDSGLVVLCPKDKVDNVFVDIAEYVAVIGNGEYLAPKGRQQSQKLKTRLLSKEEPKIEILSKLRKARGDDTIVTTKVMICDGASTCSDVVQICQEKFKDGIRGDANANPLDRRARRRLIHCSSLSISSLSHDDTINAELTSNTLPDDIAILSERRNRHEFEDGSFLGRGELRSNDHTTAYREINGAADGFPGWVVDRYDKWLLVQHDENFSNTKGPLPSLHDGNTAGIYYFTTRPDRSVMGASIIPSSLATFNTKNVGKGMKPILLEGQPAPKILPVKENGITYHVRLGEDFSTGIFLDQRPQRAWLASYCTPETRVLNCFAHCGAFSIAAATAGAKTVSLDLDKKWLDRIEPQMIANGISNFGERHDCIYGDCFDWLARFGKRGEKFDIVIVDPPSTSVGGKKKKRWSAKNDYSELVSLAAPLVKKGGLLWTTTNSASIHPIKFARMCKRGLQSVGLENAKLERIAAMPVDFPSVGPPPVKNLIWRIR